MSTLGLLVNKLNFYYILYFVTCYQYFIMFTQYIIDKVYVLLFKKGQWVMWNIIFRNK